MKHSKPAASSEKVAIILGNYKGYAAEFLPDCIASIRAQSYGGEIGLYIYDNETSSETEAFLRKTVPEAELVLNQENDGFAKGNNDCIKRALAQNCGYIFCLNIDTILDRDCVANMVQGFEQAIANDKRDSSSVTDVAAKRHLPMAIGAVQARLMLHPETNIINSLGNTTHFLGFGYCLGYREEYESPAMNGALDQAAWKQDGAGRRSFVRPGAEEIAYPSGAAVMFKAEALRAVGLFDEAMWMYNEDQDLGWRIWLSGRRCVVAPQAVVYHKYRFVRSHAKYYFMDRNRIITLLKNYHLMTLLAIAPAFVAFECGVLLFAVKEGWLQDKLKVWAYFLRPSTWGYLGRARKSSQRLRQVSDRQILSLFAGDIWYQEIDDWKLRAANRIFGFYFRMLKRLVAW